MLLGSLLIPGANIMLSADPNVSPLQFAIRISRLLFYQI